MNPPKPKDPVDLIREVGDKAMRLLAKELSADTKNPFEDFTLPKPKR